MMRLSSVKWVSSFSMTAATVLALTGTGCSTREPLSAHTRPAVRPASSDVPPTTPKRATETDAPKGPVSLDQAIAKALANNGEIAIARAGVDVASEGFRAAHDWQDPAFGFGVRQDTQDTVANRWNYDTIGLTTIVTQDVRSATQEGDTTVMSLSVYPPNPWEYAGRIAGAKADRQAAGDDLKAVQWLTTIEVKRLFAECDYLYNDLELLNELIKIQKEGVDSTKELMNQGGEATAQDVVTASRRYLGMLGDKNRTAQEYASIRNALATMIGVSGRSLQLITTTNTFPRVNAAKLDPDLMEAKALQNRADLAALQSRAHSAREAYNEDKAIRIPWVQQVQATIVSGSSEESGNIGSGTFGVDPALQRSLDTSDSSEWRVDASISIPIFSWLGNGPEKSRAEYRLAQITQDEKARTISRDVRNAVETLKNIQRNQENYEAETRPVINDMNELSVTLTDAELPPFETARLRSEILETRRMKLRSEYEVRMATIALEDAMGAPLK